MKNKSERDAAGDLGTGEELETAMLSPVIGGCIRTWTDARSFVWRLDDPASASRLLGSGAVARTGVERDRFREVGLVSVSRGTLLIPERLHADTRTPDEVLGAAKVFALERVTAPGAAGGPEWREFCDWLRVVVPQAAARGEFVVIERGGWDHQPEPFAFTMCAPGDRGWMSHIEAVPPPPEGSAWPPKASPNQKGQTVSAPANAETLRAAAVLLVDAVIGWAASPLDVALTFGTSPHGPYKA